MPRKHSRVTGDGRLILIIDDNDEYRKSTEDVLRRAGHTVVGAADAQSGLQLARTQPFELVLVDYHMPGMNGEEFVVELRKSDTLVQVILQTGYAREHPPREMLRRMEIQGYYDKSEGPEKLLLWTDVGLKAATAVRTLERSRRGLRYILGATQELHRPQPVDRLLESILHQTTGLLGIVDSFIAVPRSTAASEGDAAFVAVLGENNELQIHAGTGRFAPTSSENATVGPELATVIAQAFDGKDATRIEGAVVLPLIVGGTPIGVVYLEAPAKPGDLELFQILANQASVAIYNAHLHEMAAIDKLTGACTRRFLDQSLLREVRAAHRFRMPLSLLMIDVDHMKAINDEHGHLGGDAALAEIGALLRESTRPIDVVGRHGGDEFVVVLAGTDLDGARVVAERIMAGLEGMEITVGDACIPVRASIGVAALDTRREDYSQASLPKDGLDAMATRLVAAADKSLYSAKSGGRFRCGEPELLRWSAVPGSREETPPVVDAIAIGA